MSSVPAPRTLIGHPRGLFVLFFAEMWERFSYYGMRGLLILYLTKHFLFADDHANLVYGAYTSLVYIMPVIGGWLADRWLGGRKAVLFGGALIALGHFTLAIEGPGDDPVYVDLFFLALSFIIVGTGFLKANISTIVGTLYARDDARRDPAFTIFYMGINLGTIIGSLACGYLGERVGWRYGFGAAGIGMLLGLLVFVVFRRELLGRSEPPDPAWLRARTGGLPREAWIYLSSILGVIGIWWLLQHQALVGSLLAIAGAILVAYILFVAVRRLPPRERDRIVAAIVLILSSILFWALFEQGGSSLNLFTDRRVDRTLLGFDIPASMFQSLSGFWIVTMAPVLAGLWTWLGKHGWEPSTLAKFGLGIAQLGIGFLVLVGGTLAAGPALTPAIYIILIYFFHSTGELCLSPVGLSAMTKLALPQMAGLMMGAWFMALGAGNFSAGLIAAATGGKGATPETVLDVYTRVSWIAIGVGVVMILLARPFARLMHLDRLGEDQALPGMRELVEPDAAGIATQVKRA